MMPTRRALAKIEATKARTPNEGGCPMVRA